MMNKKDDLILIGMPGSGKSTCGVLAAKALCKSFLDTDLLIQTREGMSLQELIDQKGVEYFARAEENALLGIRERGSVIATGGSAVYYENAMDHLRGNGIVIYLQISFPVMQRRITNITTRGILLHNGESLEEMFRAREALYRKYADVIIDCDALTIEETVAAICRCCGC